MPTEIGVVVPLNIERAKRIAKQLNKYYPRKPLAACQATTAHLYGHKDWHGLEVAVKTRMARGPFDENLKPSEIRQRWDAQSKILCRDLGGFDPDAEKTSPKGFASVPLMHDVDTEVRLANALGRYSVIYAREVQQSILPTAEEFLPQDKYTDLLCACSRDQLVALPEQLGQWWSVNVEHQVEVGQALKNFVLDVDSRPSLLSFGHYWGTLCMYYAETIAWDLAMGTAYLLAERFGSLAAQNSEPFVRFIDAEEEPSNAMVDKLTEDLLKIQITAANEFFDCYPRDDFAVTFRAQPEAFIKNANSTMKILSTPGSKRGTWAYVQRQR